jgi:hypothetical protein
MAGLGAGRLSVAQTERDLVGRGELDSRRRDQRGHQVCRPDGVIEHDVSGRHGRRERGKALDGRRRQVEVGEISRGQYFGGWEKVRESVGEARYARPEPLHDPAQARSRLTVVIAFLRDDGLHGCLERAPGAWRADSRADVGPDHPARSLRHVYQAFPVRQVGPQQQVAGSSRVNLQHAGGAIEADRPAVYAAGHRLDTGHRAVGEERSHRIPVEWRLEWQPHHQPAVGGEPVGPAAAVPQLAGRSPEYLAHLPVELADAGKSRRECHVRYGQVGVVKQPPGEVRAARPGQLIRGYAQMIIEDPPQMPRRDREPRPERCLAAGVQHAVDDQLNRPADKFWRPGRDRARHPVRAAAQAGAEPRRFRARGKLEGTHVLRQRPRSAARPAVDPGRHHR